LIHFYKRKKNVNMFATRTVRDNVEELTFYF